MISDFDDDETNFSHKLLLINRQFANLLKAFTNKSSVDIKLSKTQTYRMAQLERFHGRFLVPLLKTGSPLIKKLIKPLVKSILVPLELIASASAADAKTDLKKCYFLVIQH